MPRMPVLPPTNTIMGLKGVLDFYTWRGIPCVRSWPSPPKLPRAPLVQQQTALMADYVARLKYIDPKFVDDARTFTSGTNWSWRDMTIRAAWGHLVQP